MKRLLLCSFLLFTVACGGSENKKYVDEMAAAHKGDDPRASAAALREPDHEVATKTVSYAQVDGVDVQGFLAQPSDVEEQKYGLIVIHEWWGLNDNIRSMTKQLAARGYYALAVDLYDGRVANTPEEARGLMTTAMDNHELTQSNLRKAYGYLREQGVEKIGIIGWGLGGYWSLQTTLELGVAISATVVYYGKPEADPVRLRSKLRSPFLGIYARKDKSIDHEDVREFVMATQKMPYPMLVKSYPDVGHAFASPSGTNYNAAAADDAWKSTLKWLRTHVKGQGKKANKPAGEG